MTPTPSSLTVNNHGTSSSPEAVVAVVKAPARYAEKDQVDAAIVEALARLNLPDGFIRPDDRVVLKPNWIKEHDERKPGPGQWEHVITHPAVIEAVVRWVAPQLGPNGYIAICDAPQTDSSFSHIREYCRLDEMLARCRSDHPGIAIDIIDLRPEEWLANDGITVAKTKLPGDPLGSTQVNLGSGSELEGYSGCGQLYGASYDMQETNYHHTGGRHEYLLCRTPMDADVLINIPKLKTHKKVGVTCALKNLVGINANKNWLPHHTEGTPAAGGDQFPVNSTKARLEHAWMGAIKATLRNRPGISRLFVPIKKVGRVAFGDTQKVVRSGNWHGNDTCWRMVLDLNKCLWYFDGEGNQRSQPRRYLSIVDGIVGGEGNGPSAPDPKPCGIIIAGTHPVAVDCVAATMMGFVWEHIPLLRHAFMLQRFNFVNFAPDDITILSGNADWAGPLDSVVGAFRFRPHFGWVGAIEADPGVLSQ